MHTFIYQIIYLSINSLFVKVTGGGGCSSILVICLDKCFSWCCLRKCSRLNPLLHWLHWYGKTTSCFSCRCMLKSPTAIKITNYFNSRNKNSVKNCKSNFTKISTKFSYNFTEKMLGLGDNSMNLLPGINWLQWRQCFTLEFVGATCLIIWILKFWTLANLLGHMGHLNLKMENKILKQGFFKNYLIF